MLSNDQFRTAMRAVPMTVSVVTTALKGEPAGATIGSVTSTSMHPPLVSFNVRRASHLCSLLRRGSGFAVNVLSAEQTGLSGRFSGPVDRPADRFDGVSVAWSSTGVPLLQGALLRLLCRRYAAYPAGDHLLVVGEVLGVDLDAARAPLLYCGQSYHGLSGAAAVVSSS